MTLGTPPMFADEIQRRLSGAIGVERAGIGESSRLTRRSGCERKRYGDDASVDRRREAIVATRCGVGRHAGCTSANVVGQAAQRQ